MLVFQEGTEAFFLDVAAQGIIQEYGLDDGGQQDDVAVFYRLGAVGDVGVDQQDIPRRQEQLVFVNLVGDLPFLNKHDLQVTVPMAADVLIQEQRQIVVGDGHGKGGRAVFAQLP